MMRLSATVIEQGTTVEDIRFQAWSVQLGASMFVGQYTHTKTNTTLTFAVKVRPEAIAIYTRPSEQQQGNLVVSKANTNPLMRITSSWPFRWRISLGFQ